MFGFLPVSCTSLSCRWDNRWPVPGGPPHCQYHPTHFPPVHRIFEQSNFTSKKCLLRYLFDYSVQQRSSRFLLHNLTRLRASKNLLFCKLSRQNGCEGLWTTVSSLHFESQVFNSFWAKSSDLVGVKFRFSSWLLLFPSWTDRQTWEGAILTNSLPPSFLLFKEEKETTCTQNWGKGGRGPGVYLIFGDQFTYSDKKISQEKNTLSVLFFHEIETT